MGQTLDFNLKQLRELSEQIAEVKLALGVRPSRPFDMQIDGFTLQPEVGAQALLHIIKEKQIFTQAVLNIMKTEQKRLLAEISSQILEPTTSELKNEQ